jgi:hypothetical protein
MYVGLACDEINEYDHDVKMIEKWTLQLKAEGAA